MGAPPRTAPPGAPILSRQADDATGSDRRDNPEAIYDGVGIGEESAGTSATARLSHALIRIPTRLLELGDYLAKLTQVVESAFARIAWANAAYASNTTATTISGTSTAFVLALPPAPGTRQHVRNICLGCSAPDVLQVVASKSDASAFAASPPVLRVLGTLRLSVNKLNDWLPCELWLEPGEALYVVDLSNTGKSIDASLEYRPLSGLG